MWPTPANKVISRHELSAPGTSAAVRCRRGSNTCAALLLTRISLLRDSRTKARRLPILEKSGGDGDCPGGNQEVEPLDVELLVSAGPVAEIEPLSPKSASRARAFLP